VTKPQLENAKFELVLLSAIDEALSVYGEKPKSAIYTYLEKAQNLPKRHISERIDDFSNALEELFGLGARYLEILIMKNLHSKVEVAWEWKAPNHRVRADLTFKEYVNSVKNHLDETNKNEPQMSILIEENEALRVQK
jgi:hypothetical protein